jgi:hypothetical protein
MILPQFFPAALPFVGPQNLSTILPQFFHNSSPPRAPAKFFYNSSTILPRLVHPDCLWEKLEKEKS